MSNLITPTTEQCKIYESAGGENNLLVKAFAGSGKTHVLIGLAKLDKRPSLMMTFNKLLADEAKSRFPSNTECRTTHSIAYSVFGSQLQHKLKRPQGAYKNVAGTGTEISKFFKTGDFIYLVQGEQETRKLKAGGLGVGIKETVARFEQSSDFEMDQQHVSCSPCDNLLIRDRNSLRKYKGLVLRYAKQLWDLRVDVRSPVLATHDTYLKLYQLSKPDLSKYEVLYLDELQDQTPCVIDIFMRQEGKCKLVGVGDEFQNIYTFRGAVNGMLHLDWNQATLSKSFRWGQEVGSMANCILAKDGVFVTDIKGFEKLSTSVVCSDNLPDSFYSNKYTMLFRTNGALIQEAVRLLASNKRVNLEIDVSDFTKLLESAIELFNGNMSKVKHEKLVQFENWKEYRTEAEAVQGELIRVLKMVESGVVYRVLEVLRTHRNVENPDMILTTAHKSKGREWDYVVLADDFPSCFDKDGVWVGLPDGERNLLYVAATRVKVMLGYNKTVSELVNRANKYQKQEEYQDELVQS